jgi:RimJ/RimL family protein N-acetyltransferase
VGVDRVPYRIETERLVIRCYDPHDARLLKEAVDASIEHLRPWMPWIRFEPQTLDEKVELLRRFRGQFDLASNFAFGIFDREETKLLGGSGLHERGGEESREIGYWVAADAIGRGIATEVTAVLTRVGLELCGLERIDIQVEPANERSLAIPRKLGFTQEGVLRRRLEAGEEGGPRRDSVLFTMVKEELPGSPCLGYDYVAYDIVGDRAVPRASV